jgi:hypothetical protein
MLHGIVSRELVVVGESWLGLRRRKDEHTDLGCDVTVRKEGVIIEMLIIILSCLSVLSRNAMLSTLDSINTKIIMLSSCSSRTT